MYWSCSCVKQILLARKISVFSSPSHPIISCKGAGPRSFFPPDPTAPHIPDSLNPWCTTSLFLTFPMQSTSNLPTVFFCSRSVPFWVALPSVHNAAPRMAITHPYKSFTCPSSSSFSPNDNFLRDVCSGFFCRYIKGSISLNWKKMTFHVLQLVSMNAMNAIKTQIRRAIVYFI
jgi:hypothetical protein